MRKREAVILGILSRLRRPVLRTKFVKLVYLVDNYYAERFGETLTGFKYRYDQFGPNAEGRGIVASLRRLVSEGLANLCVGETSQGYVTYRYSAARSEYVPELSAKEWAFIDMVVRKYGRRSLKVVREAAYRTDPMQEAEPSDLLVLKVSPEIAELRARVLEDEGVQAKARDAIRRIEAGEPEVEFADLKARMAQRVPVAR